MFNLSALSTARDTPANIMSSWVGPNPPMVIRTLGFLFRDPLTHDLIESNESRSCVTLSRVHPNLVRCFAIQWELVSSVCPMRSSLPIEMISAVGFLDNFRVSVSSGFSSGVLKRKDCCKGACKCASRILSTADYDEILVIGF